MSDTQNLDLSALEGQKHQLERKSELHKLALEIQMSRLASNTKDVGKVTMVVGGALFVGYFIVKKLVKSRKKKIANPPKYGASLSQVVLKNRKEESIIAKTIKDLIAIFVMAMLKKKADSFLKASK